MAKVTIDGHQLEVPDGTTILQAARMIGGEIVPPAMCYYSKLKTSGGYCRTCIVKVTKGSEKDPRPMPKPVASCRTTVMDGMEVQNITAPDLLAARVTGPEDHVGMTALWRLTMDLGHWWFIAVGDEGQESPAAAVIQDQLMLLTFTTAERARHFSDQERVELVVTAGFYAMVPRVLDARQVPIEEASQDPGARSPRPPGVRDRGPDVRPAHRRILHPLRAASRRVGRRALHGRRRPARGAGPARR